MPHFWIWGFVCLGFQAEEVVQEAIRVEFVLVDVLALDRENRPVTDLTINDFEVRDERKKVTLESFQVQDFRDGGQAPDLAMLKLHGENLVPLRQQFIFCLDYETLPWNQHAKAFTQLHRALKESGLPQNADYMLYSMESGVLTPDFVSDLDALIAEVERREVLIRERREKVRDGYGDDAFLLDFPETRANPRTKGKGYAVEANEQLLRDKMSQLFQFLVEREEAALLAKLSLLELLATRFKQVAGPKTLFFISPGFSLSPGQALINRYTQLTRTDPDKYAIRHARSFDKEFERVVGVCTANRVAFHSLNIFLSAYETSASLKGRPSRTTGRNEYAEFLREALYEDLQGLTQLSELTGGMLSRGSDMTAALTEWIPRVRVSYLLGYQSPGEKEGEFRKIKVRCKRKGVTLHYRQGYYYGPPK